MKRSTTALIGLFCLLITAACTVNADLSYAPSADSRGLVAGRPLIAGILTTDERKEAPHRLATVMGGYGNPLSMLDTNMPVKDEVAKVFSMALIMRGDLARDGNAPYVLQVDVRKFDSDHYFASQARIDLVIQVVDRSKGQVLYTDTIVDQVKDLQLFGTGSRDLQKLAETVLGRAVDHLLDKPAFQALMGAP